ncbi:hypothetical protein [Dietzia alimentaria]|uniref:hypothetical protein n=1 Tax=Dietzia alimentaria TaxID=665550 RepID=UPI001145C4B8|nr:hypothetical protein [Dietzia alimentaria]
MQEKLGDLLEAEELGADHWILDATSAEVEAYRRVVRTLEDVVEDLGDRDREALNAANDVLHGTSRLDLIPIEVINSGKKFN